MSTIIPAATSADLLSHVPSLLGFHPARSLVLLPFVAGRTGGGLRADLPEIADTEDLERTAATLIGLVCKVARVDGVAAIVYDDAPLRVRDTLSHRALMDAVLSRADICGLRVMDALLVAPDAWASYLDAGRPRPLDDLAPLGAAAGGPVADDQFAVTEPAPMDLARRTRIAHAVDAFAHAEPHGPGPAEPDELLRHCLDVLPDTLETAIETDPVDLGVEEAAIVLVALQRPLLRDAALVQWATDLWGGEEALDAQLAYTDGVPLPHHVARMLCGRGPRPDARRLRRARELCVYLAQAVAPAERSGPFAAAAWLSWALGRSTHAGAFAAQASALDPDHGLAGIVRAMIDGLYLPEWVFERTPEPGSTSRAGRGSSRGYRAP